MSLLQMKIFVLVATLIVTALLGASAWRSDITLEDLLPDDISHDCKTIRPIDHENIENDPILKQYRSIEPEFVKYNHAYGIPIFGVADFKDESLLRGCYLVRFMFAGNEWFRRYTRRSGIYMKGEKGGRCCPPQMGNKGLSCSCDYILTNGKTNSYPLLGMGASAHEMAHFFVKYILPKMAIDGVLKIPEFQSDEYWTYSPTEYLDSKPKDIFTDFLLNSYRQDVARGSTKIKDDALHHYFIYTGQQNFLINNWGLKETLIRQQDFKEGSKNLYALFKEIWQCESSYLPVCKDANYGFTKGLNQVMNIGKADPNNPQKMICRKDLDKPEIDYVDPIIMPSGDFQQKPGFEEDGLGKCEKVIKRGGWNIKKLTEGEIDESLGNNGDDEGFEYAWWLRKCCTRTAKFSFIKSRDYYYGYDY